MGPIRAGGRGATPSTRATPGHRRHRLHRGTSRPAAARRPRRDGPLPGSRPGQAARRAVGPPCGDRAGGRPRRRERPTRLHGRRRRLLPRALAGRARLCGDRPPRRHDHGSRCPGGGRPAHRVPGRPPPGRAALVAPRQPPRGRRDPPAQRRPDGRAAGRRRARLRISELRDAALPHRAPAGDGHPALGWHPRPADRRPRRAALPRRRSATARRRQPDVRHRRPRGAHVPGDDGRAACCRCRCSPRGCQRTG
jgi:hypothetical protein